MCSKNTILLPGNRKMFWLYHGYFVEAALRRIHCKLMCGRLQTEYFERKYANTVVTVWMRFDSIATREILLCYL